MKNITITSTPKSIVLKIAWTVCLPTLFSCSYIFFVSAATTEDESQSPHKNQKTELLATILIDNFFALKSATTPHTLSLTEVEATTDKNTAVVTFNVSDLILGRIYYSTTSLINTNETPWVSPSSYTSYANSRGTIRHLTGSTTYYYKVYAKDFYGNTAISDEQLFITK